MQLAPSKWMPCPWVKLARRIDPIHREHRTPPQGRPFSRQALKTKPEEIAPTALRSACITQCVADTWNETHDAEAMATFLASGMRQSTASQAQHPLGSLLRLPLAHAALALSPHGAQTHNAHRGQNPVCCVEATGPFGSRALAEGAGHARATTTASWAKGPAWRRGQCRVAQGMDVCTRDPPIGRGRFDLSQIALAAAACLHGVACMHPHRIPRSVPLIRAGALDGMALPAVAHVHTGSRSRSHVQGAKRHALETHAAHRRLPAPQCPPQHSESAIPIQKRGGVNNMRHCSLLVRSDAATGIR